MAKAIAFMARRRLSTRDICGEIPKLFKLWEKDPESVQKGSGATGKLHLCKIGGIAFKNETVPDTTGQMADSERLVGDFKATNCLTGEAFRSNRLFLPTVASDMVCSQLAGAKTVDKSASVQFAYDIFIAPDENENSATGYVYLVEPIIKEKETDAMKAVDAAIALQSSR